MPRVNRKLGARAMLVLAVIIVLSATDIRIYQAGPLKPVLQPYDFYSTIGQEAGQTL